MQQLARALYIPESAVKAAGQVPLRQPDSQEPEAYDPAQGNLELHRC